MAKTFASQRRVIPGAADFLSAAHDHIARLVKDDLFAGAVLVAAGDDILLREGFGLADREHRAPHTPASQFRLGSLTKQFTAAAILQLMEDGQLALDDRIAQHFPDALAHWREVRLIHLLTHTSGIPSYTSIPGFFEKEARREHSPREIIALTDHAPLLFEPGSEFKYNNGGYVILGHIVERVTGTSYETFLSDHLLRPLGLNDTGYERTDRPLRTRGYRVENGRIENAAFLAMSVPYAAGAVYSAADDLLSWLSALKTAKPISAASVALMMKDHGHGYGMGFAIQSQFSRRHLVHAGGINGFSVVMSHYPDDDLTILALANIQGAPVQTLARDLAALYFGVEENDGVALDPALLADYVGSYQLGEDKILRVTQESARLFIEWDGMAYEAKAEDDHCFSVKPGGWPLVFDSDGVSLAHRATLTVSGQKWSGPRIEDGGPAESKSCKTV
ncbi:MAG TPA: serine hydrolase domain-containing protein [Methylovirgula sp.]